MKNVTVFGYQSNFCAILFLHFLLSLSFNWEDIHDNQDRVWPYYQTLWSLSKILRCASYIELSSQSLGLWSKQYFVFDVMVIVSFTLSRFTSKNGTVYAIALQWPFTGVLALGAPISTENTQVTMLGYEGKFAWKPATDKGGLIVTVPCIPTNKLKSKWAWVFKLEYVH